LHFGLLSFGGPKERQFGGVGVMVDAPGLSISLRRAERLSAAGPLAERAIEFARQVAANWEAADGPQPAASVAMSSGEPAVHIEIESAPQQHVGLGTGTQLGLAVAAGLARLAQATSGTAGGAAVGNGAVCDPVSDSDAVRWARWIGRGERSAIGTHGFARGGLLVEGGKRAAGTVSPLVSRLELPDAWRFVLLIDREKRGLSGPQECRAFADLPPTEPEVTASLCREVLVELLPAAAEGDFDTFGESLYRYGHEAGLLFAQRQGGAYAAGLQTELVAWLRTQGVRGVGQSSWGPTIFALARDPAQAAALAADVGRHFAAAQLIAIVAAPANRGALIECT
jgi:beta-RFAP synthase